MRHPTEGLLRRLLDEPSGVPECDREHVAGCAQCLRELVNMREDAALIDAALATDDRTDLDLAASWHRLSTAAAATAPRQLAAASRNDRWRLRLRRPVVAAVAFAVVLTGAGTAAANDWLQIFRTEQIASVSFSTGDLVALPDLSAYGDVVVTRDVDVHPVPDAATAAAQTGLDVPEVVALPRGVTGKPVYQVGSQVNATFTFSADAAADAAAANRQTLPPPPPGLNDSQVRLVAGPGVAAIWSSSAGAPALIVGRAVAPRAFSSGVPFETVRDYLLSLPGLPDGVAAQLRAFAGDGSTLPLPVPADEFATSSAQVNGQSATVLTTRDRTMAAVVWVEEGIVTVVAGSLDADEVLTVAGNLS